MARYQLRPKQLTLQIAPGRVCLFSQRENMAKLSGKMRDKNCSSDVRLEECRQFFQRQPLILSNLTVMLSVHGVWHVSAAVLSTILPLSLASVLGARTPLQRHCRRMLESASRVAGEFIALWCGIKYGCVKLYTAHIRMGHISRILIKLFRCRECGAWCV